jgi:adenine-specific DNA-methyltransferase
MKDNTKQHMPTAHEKKKTSNIKQKLPLNQIILGDCVEELKKLPDRSVDLIVLDPPYWKVINEHWDYQWRTESDYAKWCLEWFTELSRVIKLSGSLYLFGYMRNLVYLYKDILDLGFIFRQQIVIDKGMQALGGRATKGYKMFPNVTESLLFFIFDSKPFIKDFLKERQRALNLTSLDINKLLGVKINGGGVWSLYTGENILAQVPTREMWEKLQQALKFDMPYEEIGQTFNIEMGITDVWTDIKFYKEKRHHPTQKPVDLIKRIISASTHEGMVVLDPFMGAGSTALAAMELKRHFIGMELEKGYVKAANERIQMLKEQGTLF